VKNRALRGQTGHEPVPGSLKCAKIGKTSQTSRAHANRPSGSQPEPATGPGRAGSRARPPVARLAANGATPRGRRGRPPAHARMCLRAGHPTNGATPRGPAGLTCVHLERRGCGQSWPATWRACTRRPGCQLHVPDHPFAR
jgi:hypothetical protein